MKEMKEIIWLTVGFEKIINKTFNEHGKCQTKLKKNS